MYTENIIKYALLMQSLFVVNRVSEEVYTKFFERITAKLNEVDFVVNYSFDSNKRITMNIQGKNISHKKDRIIISANLLELMGFENDEFKLGIRTSTVSFNEEAFNALESSTVMTFRLFKKEFLDLYMPEPKTTELRDVITDLNLCFSTQTRNQYYVQFYYADGYLVLAKGDLPSDVEIELPPLLWKYFGIPAGSKFSPGGKFVTSAEIIDEEEQIEFDHERGDIPVTGPPKKLLITTNVVKNQLYGDKLVGLLREVDMSVDETKVTRVEPMNLLDLPTCCHELNTISVKFVDEYLRPVELETPTSVTLEFKPRH